MRDVNARGSESGTQDGDAESVWVDATVGACGSAIKPAGLNRRMRKTACPVVWEGWRAQSRQLDPIVLHQGCETLLSEDLQHGQIIEGVRVVNPFRAAK